MNEELAYTLEGYIVQRDDPRWQDAPDWLKGLWLDDHPKGEMGYPSSLALYEGEWFWIGCGQGPAIFARESEPMENYV